MPGVSSAGSLVGILTMVVAQLVGFRLSSSYDRCVDRSLMNEIDVKLTRNFRIFAISPIRLVPLDTHIQMVRRTTYLGIDPSYDSKHVTTPRLLPPTSLFISSPPLLELSPSRIRPRDLFISLCLPLRLHVSTTRSNWRIPSRTPSTPPRNSPRNVPCNTFFRSKTSFNRKYFIRIIRRALNGCRGG